jgi:hypothetical protein
MSFSFADYNKSRKDQFDKLATQLNKQTNNAKTQDDRFWKLEVDKAGNGYAVIRFLPQHHTEMEHAPYVLYFDHGFQGPGGWYIEKSLTSIGKADPVSEYNRQLWTSGLEENKKVASDQKRRMHYVANIYIVKDPANPSNEGKVFLYQFGKKIFDKINDLMFPQFQDEKAINPFDLVDGSNFKLKARGMGRDRNYDKSEFEESSPLFDEESKYDAVLSKIQPLQTFLDPTQYKTYDELKTRLNKVLGWDKNAFEDRAKVTERAEDFEEDSTPPFALKSAKPSAVDLSEDDDDGLDFFNKLNED